MLLLTYYTHTAATGIRVCLPVAADGYAATVQEEQSLFENSCATSARLVLSQKFFIPNFSYNDDSELGLQVHFSLLWSVTQWI